MINFLKLLVVFVCLFIQADELFAQGIKGQVVDEKKEPMLNAEILVYHEGVMKGGTITDFDGFYVIRPLDPGIYKVFVMYAGFDSVQKDIEIVGDSLGVFNCQMTRHTMLKEYDERHYVLKPLVKNKDGFISGTVVDEKMAPVVNATVCIVWNNETQAIVHTDTAGYYYKSEWPGLRDVMVCQNGYDTLKITQVKLRRGLTTTVNFILHKTGSEKNRKPRKNVCTLGQEPKTTEEWEQFFLIDEIKHLPK